MIDKELIIKFREEMLNSYVDLGRTLDLYRESRTRKGESKREFKDIFKNTNQITQDITKVISQYISDIFFWKCKDIGIPVTQDEKNGSDLEFFGESYEMKISKAKFEKNGMCVTSKWTGNKFLKVPKHILISYYLDFETNRISHMFIGIIDLSKCKSFWKNGTSKVNFSNLTIAIEDADNMEIIIGNRKDMRKNTKFLLEKLIIN